MRDGVLDTSLHLTTVALPSTCLQCHTYKNMVDHSVLVYANTQSWHLLAYQCFHGSSTVLFRFLMISSGMKHLSLQEHLCQLVDCSDTHGLYRYKTVIQACIYVIRSQMKSYQIYEKHVTLWHWWGEGWREKNTIKFQSNL